MPRETITEGSIKSLTKGANKPNSGANPRPIKPPPAPTKPISNQTPQSSNSNNANSADR